MFWYSSGQCTEISLQYVGVKDAIDKNSEYRSSILYSFLNEKLFPDFIRSIGDAVKLALLPLVIEEVDTIFRQHETPSTSTVFSRSS